MASRALLGFSSFLSFALLAIGIALSAQAKDWPPISAEELAMKEYPPIPGAPAIILYREVYITDVRGFATEYYRIKILKEEGKKYADVSIPFAGVEVLGIQARTVHPDGTVVNFDGQVFEKPIAKTRRRKILVKTFALPEVKVGSIIEYKYRISRQYFSMSEWRSGLAMRVIRGVLKRGGSWPTQPWRVQQRLFARRVRFSFEPWKDVPLGSTWLGLPTSKGPSYQADGTLQLELENIPAFEEEEYMPPESFLKSRVAFVYVEKTAGQPESFWSGQGKLRAKEIEEFIGKRKGIRRAVAEIITPDDPPEAKLSKLCARVQQIRDLRNDRSMSDKEKQEAYKKNKNVEDVLKRGYGNGAQINRLFAALARAAGFDTYVVRIVGRDERFFNRNLLDWSQLDHEVVMVRSGSKDLYLDPSNPYCPFGFLSWEETGVQGVLLQKSGGVLIKTPLPESANAVIERKAELQLSPDGTLKGQVHVSFTGQEALKRRLEAALLQKSDSIPNALPPDRLGDGQKRLHLPI